MLSEKELMKAIEEIADNKEFSQPERERIALLQVLLSIHTELAVIRRILWIPIVCAVILVIHFVF